MASESQNTRKATSTTSSRYEPYKDRRSGHARRPSSKELQQEPLPAPAAIAIPAGHSDAQLDEEPTMRDLCLEIAHKLYPGITPRHDIDICALASGNYAGPLENEAVYEWVDEQIRLHQSILGNNGSASQAGTSSSFDTHNALLDQRGEIGGFKPRPTQRHVYIRPIPDSEYSIRLWPGIAHVHEFNLDFVNTKTHEAVNSPFKYELWAIPDQKTPWLSMGGRKLQSLENAFGIKTSEIKAGEEKFILKEGLTCLLVRPGKRNVCFKVPIRRQEVEVDGPSCDILDLPDFID